MYCFEPHCVFYDSFTSVTMDHSVHVDSIQRANVLYIVSVRFNVYKVVLTRIRAALRYVHLIFMCLESF